MRQLVRKPRWASNAFPYQSREHGLLQPSHAVCSQPAAPGRLSKLRHRGKEGPGAFRSVTGPVSILGALGRGVSLLRRTGWQKAGAQRKGRESWSPAKSCARAGMVHFLPTKLKQIHSCSAAHTSKLLTDNAGKKCPSEGQ